MDGEKKEGFNNFVELMRNSIDNTKDPCEDFVTFACGNFDENSDLNRYTENQADVLLNEDLSYPALLKARRFHESYPVDVRSFVQCPGLREISGGWAALDEEWTGENFRLIQTVGTLAAMGCNTLFSCNVEYSRRGRVVILYHIEPPYYLSDGDFDDNGRVDNLLSQLGIHENKIPEIINDINLVAERIHEIPRDLDALNTMPRLLPEEIRNRPEWNYEEFFEAFLGEQISQDDVFFISSVEDGHFERYLTMLQELEPRVLSNYLLILVADNFDSYNCMTMTYLASIVTAAGFEAYFNKKDEEDCYEIHKRFDALTERIQDLLHPNYDGDIISNACQKFQDTMELKNTYFTLEEVEKEYEGLEIVSNDYFQNVLNIQRFGITESTRRYYSVRHDEPDELINVFTYIKSIHNKPFLAKYCILVNTLWYGFATVDIENEKFKLMEKTFQNQINMLDLPEYQDNYSYEITYAVKKSLILKAAFEDYKKWLEENEAVAREQEEMLKEVGLNNLQAFFVCWEMVHKGCDCDIVNKLCYSNLEEFLEVFKIKTDTFKVE